MTCCESSSSPFVQITFVAATQLGHLSAVRLKTVQGLFEDFSCAVLRFFVVRFVKKMFCPLGVVYDRWLQTQPLKQAAAKALAA